MVEFNSPSSDEVVDVDSIPINNHGCTRYAVNGNLGVFFVQQVPGLVTRRNIALGKGAVLCFCFFLLASSRGGWDEVGAERKIHGEKEVSHRCCERRHPTAIFLVGGRDLYGNFAERNTLLYGSGR
jgi:hypothetical protein